MEEKIIKYKYWLKHFNGKQNWIRPSRSFVPVNIATCVILLLAYLFADYSIAHLEKSINRTTTAQSFGNNLQVIYTQCLNADNALDAYARNSSKQVLNDYYTSKPTIDIAFKSLYRDSDPSQRIKLDTLAELLNNKFEYAPVTLNKGRIVVKTDSANKDQSYAQTQDIRKLLDRIESRELEILNFIQIQRTKDISILSKVVLCLFVLGILINIIGIIFYKRENISRKRSDARVKNYQEAFLHSLVEIQEQMFQNISQEMHDNIGQVLSLAKLNLATASELSKEAMSQKVTDTHSLLARALKDLRHLSHKLSTDYILQFGLKESIQSELEMIEKAGLFTTDFEISGESWEIPKQHELILFRIIQEVLTNIIKHAEAKKIKVILAYMGNKLVMSVNDDGRGIENVSFHRNTTRPFGLGLANLKKRAEAINAEFTVEGNAGKGTMVRIEMPLK